ncbi:MAG: bifunctional riboflavin kinase/FAD synthetase [Pseudochelatococcus sp.]|jgi:riboflavin kinase/FMN adenylyltransferase|uniref:bifunctional riboflavin kinase/FAD synthetase n=1 Tax=Pseudochelatococcus sp. TaxID=2020869 RepID=UPI003D92D42F
MTASAPHLPLSAPRVLPGFTPLPGELARPVLAIGNFDGVHRGHQRVIGAAAALARDLGRPAIALTFEPHPRSFFAPSRPMFRITPPPLKAAILQAFGVDAVIAFTFDAAFAGLTAGQFLHDLLVELYAASGVVVGHDFHFGKGREGSPAFLCTHAGNRGLPVTVVEPVREAENPVSSSAIREALSAGDIAAAGRLLGYRWIVQAEVVHGDARGRVLGYPTANMRLDPACGLRHGIYAVRMRVDGVVHAGVASFGRRPTFDDGAPLLETHLFDFAGDLYGKRPAIEFLEWLRPELKFDGIDALVAQMDRDSAGARAIATQANVRCPPSLLG